MTATEELAADSRPFNGSRPRRVAYLLGAGATQGAVAYSGSAINLLMRGLSNDFSREIKRGGVMDDFAEDLELVKGFINAVVTDEADIEQLTTFLEDAPSEVHRRLAAKFKDVFRSVLQQRLDEAKSHGSPAHTDLYAVLVDMHQIQDSGENLTGILTLNYDAFLERAIESRLSLPVDYGVSVEARPLTGSGSTARPVKVLKMHGSFSWTDSWPMAANTGGTPGRWIPPGIRKAKGDYPFNAIWGLAREVLDCDVLRIIGCQLGKNDWDLVSLLFTTRYAHHDGRSPYVVELIASPHTAEEIKGRFPYLGAQSILELDGIGGNIVVETLGFSSPFAVLDVEQKKSVMKAARSKIGNPFEFWLRQKGEIMARDLPTIATRSGIFESFVTGTVDGQDPSI